MTHYAAVCLFLVFGARMLNESREASNAASDELEEVEAELSKKQATYTSVGTQDTQVRGFPHRLGGCTDQAQGLAGGEEARERGTPWVGTSWPGERDGEGVG